MKVLIAMPEGKRGSSFYINQTRFVNGEMQYTAIGYTAFIGEDGSLVMGYGGDLSAARLRRENLRLDMSKASAIVQSDFVDSKTGDTVSLIQARGRDWKNWALLPQLGPPAKLGEFDSWALAGDFPLNIVSWQANGTTYVLASNKVAVEQLAVLARSAS